MSSLSDLPGVGNMPSEVKEASSRKSNRSVSNPDCEEPGLRSEQRKVIEPAAPRPCAMSWPHDDSQATRVIISHCSESTLPIKSNTQYGIQLERTQSEIVAMEDKLKEISAGSLIPHHDVGAGSYVLLFFGNELCRGYVTEVTHPDHVRVLYVDYGNYESVSPDHLYQMDANIATVPWMAYQCIFADDSEPLAPNEKCTIEVRARLIGPDGVPVYLAELTAGHGAKRRNNQANTGQAAGTSKVSLAVKAMDSMDERIASYVKEFAMNRATTLKSRTCQTATDFLMAQKKAGIFSRAHVISILAPGPRNELNVILQLSDSEYCGRPWGHRCLALESEFVVRVINKITDLTAGEIVIVRALGSMADDGCLPVMLHLAL